MSYWGYVTITDTRGTVIDVDSGDAIGNSTSNHSPAWTAALTATAPDGVEPADAVLAQDKAEAGDGWRWSLADTEGLPAAVLADWYREAAMAIGAKPWDYEPLVRGGGTWGNAAGAAEYLERAATACEEFRYVPSASVRWSH